MPDPVLADIPAETTESAVSDPPAPPTPADQTVAGSTDPAPEVVDSGTATAPIGEPAPAAVVLEDPAPLVAEVAETTIAEEIPAVERETVVVSASDVGVLDLGLTPEPVAVVETTTIADPVLADPVPAPEVAIVAETSVTAEPTITATVDPVIVADPPVVADPVTTDDYVNPIDVESEKLAALVDAKRANLTTEQIVEVFEDSLPAVISLKCLREQAPAPEQFKGFVADLNKSNRHALRNLLSRRIRRHTIETKVNREQSLILADAMIAHGLTVAVDIVAACYAAVEPGSFTEE